ncbi:MAG: LPS export ABC transporter periplasmic protein LptC [Syntrophotalea acetylenica]|jgi:LPS export ABC transporter protein LptC|uniref:LPS export ABC transporter periplasmic protein LptC n=1 Tax=Syntrophotalea acetylenica TaxID=29542 RepID=UPI0009F9764D|nr:LPS export ABC transporter periplasmic protein LptC [Syntrophotalea acetylenica]MDD4458163.1 LPS export ABC transporter periplasmic protein LptC [Syntrophotalea acetylenica]MDY0261194.1 LPS export ABC transporter periplasmic protein LptC [Syntrophotalea acetylenica]
MIRRVTIRNLLLIAILALCLALGFRIYSHRRETPPESVVDALPSGTDLSLQDVQYTETSQGIRRWSLAARSAAYDAGQGQSAVQDMRVEFFDREGRLQMVLTAREGLWTQNSGDIVAKGDVVVKAVEGYTLSSEELRYQSATDQVSTDKPVRLEDNNLQLDARGMRYGLKDRSLKLFSEVRATLNTQGTGF